MLCAYALWGSPLNKICDALWNAEHYHVVKGEFADLFWRYEAIFLQIAPCTSLFKLLFKSANLIAGALREIGCIGQFGGSKIAEG